MGQSVVECSCVHVHTHMTRPYRGPVVCHMPEAVSRTRWFSGEDKNKAVKQTVPVAHAGLGFLLVAQERDTTGVQL